MGEHQRRVGGEGAQHPGCGAVVELVEAAAQDLAIKRDGALSRGLARRLQQAGMAAERSLHRGRIEALQDVADGGVGRRSAPLEAEDRVQPLAVHVDEGDDAAIRVAAADDGQDGEQQHVGQFVHLALRAARIGNLLQDVQQRRERGHGNLRSGDRQVSDMRRKGNLPRSQSNHRANRLLQTALSHTKSIALDRPGCATWRCRGRPEATPWPLLSSGRHGRNCSPGRDAVQASTGIGSPRSVRRMASMARTERRRAVSMTDLMSA